MELLKMLSVNEIFAQILSFLLLLFLLKHFAWKKILKSLDDRKEKIAFEFRGIEEIKAGLFKIETEYAAKFSAIEELASQKIQEASEAGKKISEEMRKKAYEESQVIIESAKQSMKYELSKAKEELKSQIVDLVIQGAGEIIEERLSEEQDRKLVEGFLDKLERVE